MLILFSIYKVLPLLIQYPPPQFQYVVFIHDALLEAIMCGDNSIKAPEMKAKVKELPGLGTRDWQDIARDTVELSSPSIFLVRCCFSMQPTQSKPQFQLLLQLSIS